MKLYTYFRSSAAYRVRIVLGLKGLSWEAVPVHMLRGGGEQHSTEYRSVNPMGLVPSLETEGAVITQSLAVCEYLEERFPEPPVLPSEPRHRAYVRAIAGNIACDIHPLNNLRVLAYLTGRLGLGEDEKLAWYQHWITLGFEGLETLLGRAGLAGRYCFGDTPTLADAFLVPQVYNARRFRCPLDAFPVLTRIAQTADETVPFAAARPEAQADSKA